MCACSFTVFTSVFQLLPTAPYRMLELGGSTVVAGLFLGFMTYSSAFSAPFTGHVADRIGHRPVLITVSLVLALFTASYAFIASPAIMLGVVIVHGVSDFDQRRREEARRAAATFASRITYRLLGSETTVARSPPQRTHLS